MLIKNFPYVASKVFLLTKFSSKEDIQDPINKNKEFYEKVMNEIEKNIDLWVTKI